MTPAPRRRPALADPRPRLVADQPEAADPDNQATTGRPLVALLEPMLGIADLARLLACDRRTIERMRSAGRLPRPDLVIGTRSPRWLPMTIRRWVESGGRA